MLDESRRRSGEEEKKMNKVSLMGVPQMGGKSESQMKVLFAIISCVCVAGCGDERSGDIENPVAETRRFITALSNGSVRCDAVCKDIALRVRALADASAKRQLAEEWENAFFSYPVESLSYRGAEDAR